MLALQTIRRSECTGKECLSLVGLSNERHIFHRKCPAESSSGLHRQGNCSQTKVIFADETTGELDSQTDTGMKILKRLISAEGATIVITTHDPKLMEVGDAVYELKDGKAERQ